MIFILARKAANPESLSQISSKAGGELGCQIKRMYEPNDSVSGEALADFMQRHKANLPPMAENKLITNLIDYDRK